MAPKKSTYAPANYGSVAEALVGLYGEKVRGAEPQMLFDRFTTSLLSDAELLAKPMVLLLGQYSAGKTTFMSIVLGLRAPTTGSVQVLGLGSEIGDAGGVLLRPLPLLGARQLLALERRRHALLVALELGALLLRLLELLLGRLQHRRLARRLAARLLELLLQHLHPRLLVAQLRCGAHGLVELGEAEILSVGKEI